MSIMLGGYILDLNLNRHQLPIATDPNNSVLDEMLLSFKDGNGVLGMQKIPEPDSGPFELKLYSESGNFLLTLNEYNDGGDIKVRTITEPNSGHGFVSILGESYSAKAVTRNFQLVSNIFNEFLKTGDVSKEIMD